MIIYFISIFDFLWFSNMFSSDALILPVSQLLKTASDDVINYVTHRIFNTDLSYSRAHSVVKMDEKSITFTAGFSTI